MIGAAIGTALKLGSSIFGGIKASDAMKSYKRGLEREQTENRAWYNQRYNEDATQRGDAQRILTKTAEAMRERNRAAAGAKAVSGGTDESVAATKMANAQGMADAASRITANGDARKDRVEAQYRQRRAALNENERQLEVNKGNNISQAVTGVGEAVGGAVAGMDSDLDEMLLPKGDRKKGGGKGSPVAV